MPGIFISYRRIDTQASAGHLFSDLNRAFGVAHVFMDINGGIPRGADFEQVLTATLTECDALLALIGPDWLSCIGRDGRRRLDVDEDWVRNEIATALRRNVPVFPVLFDGAHLPCEEELPEDLHALCKKNAAEVTDRRWDYDIHELVKDLIRHPPLKQLHAVATAKTGIELFKDLITRDPAVADAVPRFKEVIENTYRQVSRLELFKNIHDYLHEIEFQCLRPMEAGGAGSKLHRFKSNFDHQACAIQKILHVCERNLALHDDLNDSLQFAADAFDEWIKTPSKPACRRVLSELNALLSGIPPRLDGEISESAAELDLDRLVELMTTLARTLGSSAVEDRELKPLVDGTQALRRLQEDVATRVSEHGYLQRLDAKLRAVCVGGTVSGNLTEEWRRIKLVRSRLKPPFSPTFDAANNGLSELEKHIETKLAEKDKQAVEYLEVYFSLVSEVFREVDRDLRKLCGELSEVSQPLKTILSMC